MPMGTAGGAANTYYQGQLGITYAPITTGSAAKSPAGNSGYTYWNTKNDYYNVSRPSSPAIGGLEYASCALDASFCFSNSDCCNSNCNNTNTCGGSCVFNGNTCSIGANCCSGL